MQQVQGQPGIDGISFTKDQKQKNRTIAQTVYHGTADVAQW